MDPNPRQICQSFLPHQAIHAWEPLRRHGGFSGARLWRVTTSYGAYCLRAWPREQTSAEHLALVHHLLKKSAAHLPFLPRVCARTTGETWVEVGGHFWELTTWMPGAADFPSRPTQARLRSALEALARLHADWNEPGFWPPTRETIGRAPGIILRLERLDQWERIEQRRLETEVAEDHSLGELARRALTRIRRWIAPARQALVGVNRKKLALQYCLGDPWRNNILFAGDQVTGLVDFGCVRNDTVAVDLARMIGSLVGDDYAQREMALDAYTAIRPLTAEERGLVDLLDWTGVVVGVCTWLRWLYIERRRFPHLRGVAERLGELVQRIESWNERSPAVAARGPRLE